MCELKKAIWREYNAEIQEALSSSEKVRNIPIPTTEKERNYLKRMNLPDARTYFRVRCKITNNIKGNRSSQFRNDMTCRYTVIIFTGNILYRPVVHRTTQTNPYSTLQDWIWSSPANLLLLLQTCCTNLVNLLHQSGIFHEIPSSNAGRFQG